MSQEEKKGAPEVDLPAQPAPDSRTGSGADTALRAMLKKRKMRANVDNEGDVPKDDTSTGASGS